MNRLSTEQYPQSFEEAVNQVQTGEPVIITRNGADLAAIVSLEDLERLEEWENRQDIADSLEAIEEAERVGTKTLAELKQELGL